MNLPNSSNFRTALLRSLLFAACCHPGNSALAEDSPAHNQEPASFRGALLSADQITESRLDVLKASGVTGVALPIHDHVEARQAENSACRRITESGLALFFWIEVARSPELADSHPDWMASLQGHNEWRRLFKDPPEPGDGEVVKTYPWVPILSEEPFAAQLSRLEILLANRPQPDGVFLNDIQGAPSACGCGSHLCRWTSDYGNRRTTTPLGDGAPAEFVASVRKLLPDSEVIPVWTTECEEHDGAHDGLCAGVGCFKGICWKAWTAQLMPVEKEVDSIGVLLPYRAFQRDLPIYGKQAGWITHAVRSFETMPVLHQGRPIPAARLTAVLQGWDVTEEEITNQIAVAATAGVNHVLVSYVEIAQGWEPKLVKVKQPASE